MAEIREYKCPACGGAIEFDSSSQKMKCPYCDTEFEVDALKSYEEELQKEQPDDMSWESAPENGWQEGETDGMSVYICKSCGGEIIGDSNMGASSCPFCGNPIVIGGKFSGDLRPDYVIPFKLNKKQAKAALKQYLQGKVLLPKIFKDENHIDEIKGIYVPFWLFDAQADAKMRYRATRVRAWSDRDYDYTETSFFSVIRGGKLEFERVPVDGSSKMADDLMESIEPYHFEDAVDFQTAYLAGYLADKYDVTKQESTARANERVKYSTEKMFENTVNGYSTVVSENSSIQLKNTKASYALYPVWLLNTTWNGTHYMFAMNGQTGKFVGNLPVDKAAYWRWFAGLTAISGVIIYALIWLMWLL
ncbi:MAG: hypothetical protein Q4F21_09695 [Lachnospiraceae bacterium]|nr:hypothetical protein [Lachnospiraceae bacterium]